MVVDILHPIVSGRSWCSALWGLLWSGDFTALGDRGLCGLELCIISGLIVSDSFPKTMRSFESLLGWETSEGILVWLCIFRTIRTMRATPGGSFVRSNNPLFELELFKKLLRVAFPKIPVAHIQISALKPQRNLLEVTVMSKIKKGINNSGLNSGLSTREKFGDIQSISVCDLLQSHVQHPPLWRERWWGRWCKCQSSQIWMSFCFSRPCPAFQEIWMWHFGSCPPHLGQGGGFGWWHGDILTPLLVLLPCPCPSLSSLQCPHILQAFPVKMWWSFLAFFGLLVRKFNSTEMISGSSS